MRQIMLTVAVTAAVPVLPALLPALPAAADEAPTGGRIQVLPVGAEPAAAVDSNRVCRFYLAASGFRGADHVGYRVNRVSGSSRVSVSGTVFLAGGKGKSNDIRVPDGRYTISWTAPGATVPSGRRVITVACNAPAETPAAGTNAPGQPKAPGTAPGKDVDPAATAAPATAPEGPVTPLTPAPGTGGVLGTPNHSTPNDSGALTGKATEALKPLLPKWLTTVLAPGAR
ncbi:hypothetical protein DFJ69_4533 [Thermomonospora umbrina]|uniref:Uncharacterized protein n=2 Tax=Thermomonospora umbrina TaxID=111806 RepID=A0A3D9SWZ2_9ACTN|nr:hypothetical protein DFJ69_4533 [Thermomonospora umbrina]